MPVSPRSSHPLSPVVFDENAITHDGSFFPAR